VKSYLAVQMNLYFQSLCVTDFMFVFYSCYINKIYATSFSCIHFLRQTTYDGSFPLCFKDCLCKFCM